MKWLVLGASGLVGAALARAARAQGGDVVGAARHAEGEASIEVDVRDAPALDAIVSRTAPDVIAMASGWTHVDGCEADPGRSERENVGSVRNLLAAARGARLVWFSTDHVFDGSKPCHVERDPIAPASVYATHKARGEALLAADPRALIVRTAWVFGDEKRRKNFACQVIDAARGHRALRVVADQAGCPTWSAWLARAVVALVHDEMGGVVHVSGSEPLTKAAWARFIVDALGLDALEIEETSARDAGQLAPRPARVVLASERHALRQPPLANLFATEPHIAGGLDEVDHGNSH